MQISKYTMGWIGIRARRTGKSAKLLKKLGFLRIGHAEVNNRNGWDWICPCRTTKDFAAADWRSLADAGLDGIAVWFCDAQWEHCASITETQWASRAIIESKFNQNWPNGRR